MKPAPDPQAVLVEATEKLKRVHGMNVEFFNVDTNNYAELIDLMGAVALLLDDAGVRWEDIERQAANFIGTLRDDGCDGLLEVIFKSAVEPQYVEAANAMRQKAQFAHWISYRQLHWPEGIVADADTQD